MRIVHSIEMSSQAYWHFHNRGNFERQVNLGQLFLI